MIGIRSFPIGARCWGIWNTKVGSYGFRNFGSQSTIASTSMSGKTQGPKKRDHCRLRCEKVCVCVCVVSHAIVVTKKTCVFFINRHLETSMSLWLIKCVLLFVSPNSFSYRGSYFKYRGSFVFFCGNCLKIDGLVLRLTDIQVDCFDRCLVMDFQVAK